MNHYQLEQIIVFSRHGIRTPLPNTIRFLQTVTPKSWPEWNCAPGYLTTRGGTLESYFGDYFAKWLNQQNFDVNPKDIFVYANSLHRTVATAQYFTLGAFSGLDIPIHHKYPIEKMDAIFDPIIRNITPDFYQQIMDDIKQYTSSDNMIEKLDQQLKPAYDLLSDILDYKHSILYQQYQCKFSDLPTSIDMICHEEPILQGPLAIGTAVADAFTLQYYSAFNQQNVAWGMIENSQQWETITNIKNQYINLLFKSPVLANHIAKPLITFIEKMINDKKHKLIVLLGHDSNIAALTGALKFKDYQLPEQFEETPIGGKVVMQRWYDSKNQQTYFKAEYVYQTFEQLHLGTALSIHTPPKHVVLALDGLQHDGNGFYCWQDIEDRISSYLASN